jgi:hypothetical protein
MFFISLAQKIVFVILKEKRALPNPQYGGMMAKQHRKTQEKSPETQHDSVLIQQSQEHGDRK